MSSSGLVHKIHIERARLNLSQSELGVKIGVSRQTINAIENGKVKLTVVLALRMAKVFRKPIEKFISLEEEFERSGERDMGLDMGNEQKI